MTKWDRLFNCPVVYWAMLAVLAAIWLWAAN